MRISFISHYKKEKFHFQEFFNKRVHFNRVPILDEQTVSETFDNLPIEWACSSLLKMVWGGIDVSVTSEQVAQVMTVIYCGELIYSTFLVTNHVGDKLIIVLIGVAGNPVPIDLNICYEGSEDTYKTYMDELGIDDTDHIHRRQKPLDKEEKLCQIFPDVPRLQ